GMVCVVGRMRDLILQLSKSSIYSTKPPTHGAIARATFNAQIGGKVLMTLKYGNKSVPFGAIVTHGENKNGSIVAENGQVYLTGLPQSGQLQVSWGKDKNSNCIVEYKLPEVSPGTLLNQQTAICR
ncbi:FimD/PapC C-terminal domain-containing protein, partial [Escherichia coli]|uniref:FimD/PapC C-terminal domain-containing protein n=1 Tax=Escherichia coli TaxID=562 RepID=UPI003891DB0E